MQHKEEKMVGFRTNNSTYLVDQSRKQISGGIFGDRLFDYEKVVVICVSIMHNDTIAGG